jgi:glutamine amidotransferase
MIVIVDYGAGNVASIKNMLRKAGFDSRVSADPDEILDASKLILPGVGHYDHGMRGLRTRGLVGPLDASIRNKRTPILGICLGVQLFMRESEEGTEPGLGWIEGSVRRFRQDTLPANLKIPHMGWNQLELSKPSLLTTGIDPLSRFYFVHSFHLVCDHEEDVLVRASHGSPFVAGVERANIYGVQFHPEKSHRFGLELLRRFAELP